MKTKIIYLLLITLTTNLMAELSGGSSIILSVQDELDVTASGASTVFYKGNGVIVNQELSGGSEIVKTD